MYTGQDTMALHMRYRAGVGGPPTMTPNFVARTVLASVTMLPDIGIMSLDPPLQKS